MKNIVFPQLYGKEAAGLLRDISNYHCIRREQVYRLYPNNYIALDMLEGSDALSAHYTGAEKAAFEKYIDTQLARIELEKPDYAFLRERMLTMYANPARNRFSVMGDDV